MTQTQTAATIRELARGIRFLAIAAADAAIDMQVQSRPGQKPPSFKQMVESLSAPLLQRLEKLEDTLSTTE